MQKIEYNSKSDGSESDYCYSPWCIWIGRVSNVFRFLVVLLYGDGNCIRWVRLCDLPVEQCLQGFLSAFCSGVLCK